MTTKMLTIRETSAFLLGTDNILILTHQNPDGDTCGSAAALCVALRSLGKCCYIFPNSTVTNRYLPFIEKYLAQDSAWQPETVVSVDVADTTLLTDESKRYSQDVALCIDHHPSNVLYAKYTLLDAEAAATGEIILDLVRDIGAEVTQDIALPLYLAIATDTGCFRFSNTTSRTFRAAADLLETGIDFVDINNRFFETKSKSRLLIEQRINENIRYFDNGRTAIAALTKQLINDTGAKEEDIENISSFLRSIEGVEIAVLLRERGDNLWKISVRTSSAANASAICSLLGGGGHARAAGCTYSGSYDEAVAAIIRSIETEKT